MADLWNKENCEVDLLLIYIGRLSFAEGRRYIYLNPDGKKTAHRKEMLVLTSREIDHVWFEDIVKSTNYCTSENCWKVSSRNKKYLLLYVIFSTRKRIYLEDILDLEDAPIIAAINRQACDLQTFFFNDLRCFMKKNSYHYKILKDHAAIFHGGVRIPWSFYRWKDFVCISGVCLCMSSLKSICISRYNLVIAYLGKIISVQFLKTKLKKLYSDVNELHFKSSSGCLFFKATNKKKEQKFIKCATITGGDIADEYFATKRISENTPDQTYYLLPDPIESNEKQLVYEYINQITLNDLLKSRSLTDKEFELLSDFLITVLKDLRQQCVFHRDIRPENILVLLDAENHVTTYKLIDFGCACLDNKINTHEWRARLKNKYAGSTFRYSLIAWNDAASSLLLLLEIPNIDIKLHSEKLYTIKDIMDEGYTLHLV